ncbi:L-rhamnose mutarotase [Leifsonia xyli]|uniref:L-rhamnose mutarotase n=1 Tax=Leifsonia xyli TaxID=1575 RepID=UPI0007D05897
MQRACFRLRVDPAHLTEYRARHAAVWPEMLAALKETGWDNYSLFLADDGWLIGYVEARDDYASIQRRMDLTKVNARWQAEMSRLFEGLDGAAPDQSFELVPEIFHLEDQLAAAQSARYDETIHESIHATDDGGDVDHHTKGARR